VLPIRDAALLWHAVHTLSEDAATVEENVLFPHSVHALGPIPVLYVPCTHPRHTDPFAPVYPTLHRQSTASSLPSGACENAGQLVQFEVACASAVEYSFTLQFVHVPMPTAVLYVPATHATHASPSVDPEYPALHEQLVSTVLAPTENVFAGQSRHMLEAVAAGSVPYLPAAQSMHASLPRSQLYVPGGHAVHPRSVVFVVSAVAFGAGAYPALQLQNETDSLPAPTVLESGGHTVQAEAPAAACVWMAHVTHVAALAAASVGDAVPAAQDVQASVPFVVLYLPAVQPRHASSPVYPSPHRQSAVLPLPSGAYELAGHGLHCVIDVAPSVSWYVSAGQRTHSLLLVADLYCPIGHTEHW
jgi:hypothetical protein